MDQLITRFANSLDVCVKTVENKLIEKIKISIINETKFNKKEIINSIYMQLGFSKKLIENILEDLFDILYKFERKR